jgi:hypothetical protein
MRLSRQTGDHFPHKHDRFVKIAARNDSKRANFFHHLPYRMRTANPQSEQINLETKSIAGILF